MSDFKFNCPACGQKISGDASYVGRQIACPACQKSFTVPAPAMAAPAAAATTSAPPPAPPSTAPAPVTAAPPPKAPAPKPPAPGEKPLSKEELAAKAVASGPGYSKLAIASLLCSLMLFIGWLPGIILGHMAKRRLNKNWFLKGGKIANAGLTISYLSLAVMIVAVLVINSLVKSTVPREYELPLDNNAFASREAELKPRILDEVTPGNPKSEEAHDAFARGNTGAWKFAGYPLRDGRNGASFGYTMAVDSTASMTLNCRYWGNEQGADRRDFDIVVDDTAIGFQNLNFNHPGHYFDVQYRIPRALTHGKDKVTVEFQARPGSMAGGVFSIQMLKP